MNHPNKPILPAILIAGIASLLTLSASAQDPHALDNIDHIIVIYQENWSFDGLYGTFPGANGIAKASSTSLTQVDRLSGKPISTLPSFQNAALTGVPTTNPPPPLAADSNGSGPDPLIVPVPNTLKPYDLTPFDDYFEPFELTGDIYHRYWQEQFQIFGTVAFPAGGDGEVGNNSGFVTWSDNPGLCMSHFNATDLPEGLLAQQYTLCDNYYHSAFGGSFLNHQFLIAAQGPVYHNMPTSNNSNIAYLDGSGVFIMNTSGPNAGMYAQDGSITPVLGDVIPVTLNGVATTVTVTFDNNQAYAEHRAFDKHYVVNTTRSVNLAGNGENGVTVPYKVSLLPSQNDSNPTNANGDTRPYIPTIGDSLSMANVSWKWYSGGWNEILAYSGSNPKPTTSPSYATVNASLQLQYHHQPFAYYDNYAPFGTGTVPAKYVGGFAGVQPVTLKPGQFGVTQAQNSGAHLQDLENFFTDVANNTLPSVVFIKNVGINNEHPGYSTLWQGQAYTASLVQAVQDNPALWAHTAIIITYDEHGGRWDHVFPPEGDIWGPGQRVPAIVISPFVKKGFVDHNYRDTSSILSTIEQRFQLPPLTARDATAPSFGDLFTYLNVTQGGFTYDHAKNTFDQTVQIKNGTSAVVDGPIYLVVGDLSSNTLLIGSAGTTGGSPYVVASTGNLKPGASVTATLRFKVPASGGITYTPRAVSGGTTP